jgi:hypothetical protein
MAWSYEPETFDLGPMGWYMPDFHLSAVNWYLEVKPARERVLDVDYDKARALHLLTQRPVLIASGFGPLPRHGQHEDRAPGWIYDLIVFSDPRGGSAVTAGAGGQGNRLLAAVDGCPVMGMPPTGQDGWLLYQCQHRAAISVPAVRHAYEEGLAFRADGR